MRTFDLLTPSDAVLRLNAALDLAGHSLGTEIIAVFDARDRILARDVISPTPLPEFRRSTVDGYAVRAMSLPGVLRVIGEIKMGEVSTQVVRLGEAVQIPTGGFVPEGADAVVMVEQVSSTIDDRPPSTDASQRSSVVYSHYVRTSRGPRRALRLDGPRHQPWPDRVASDRVD